MKKDSLIYVAGHGGLVGSAIRGSLERQGFHNLLLRTHAEFDLTDMAAVQSFFGQHQPEYVFLAAARVGGILANRTYPADFLRENLDIQTNVIEASYRNGVKRLLFLGSSCIYPKLSPQPIKEEFLLTGPLETTNQAYAIAKIAGIEACRAYNEQYRTNFLAAMPTNLYGPNDNYDLSTSHVLPALVRKVVEAKACGKEEIVVWGSGTPRREFLYSEDMADACVFLLSLDDVRFAALLADGGWPLINVGTGYDLPIRELAERICAALGFEGRLVFDRGKPDGTPRKLMDSSRIRALGWEPKISLDEGIRRICEIVETKNKGLTCV